jgi:hypothetical protein
MGLFKDLQSTHDGATRAVNPPGVVTAAELEPIAGVTLERYARLAKTIGERHLDRAGIEELARTQGLTPESWRQAYDGWNARMKVNLALSSEFGRLYQTTATF